MIEVIRQPDSPTADWIEAALREMVLGYDRLVISTESGNEHFPPDLPPDLLVQLPIIRHDDRLISGYDNLVAYLDELADLAERWRRFQSDACYIDDDGETC